MSIQLKLNNSGAWKTIPHDIDPDDLEAEQCGAYIAKLRALPATGANGVPFVNETPGGPAPSLDQRWVSIGATDLQRGFMAVIRGIAQPTTF